MLPGCNIRIVLTRQSDDFLILNNDASKKYKIKIHELSLEYRLVEVSRIRQQMHQNKLNTTEALYPFHKTKMSHITIPANIQDYSIENLVRGYLPQQVFCCFVSDEGFSGSNKSNPYCFENFGLQSFVFKINGVLGQLSCNTKISYIFSYIFS